jgi:hypothetical protein
MAGKREHYYLHVNCNDSSEFYPTNDPSDFRIKLPRPLTLEGEWECGLINLSFWPQFATSEKPKEIYICTDLIGNSYAMDGLHPILKRISVPENVITKVNINYAHVDFITLNQSILQTVQLYIMDNTGVAPSFLTKDLYCSLLLRKKKD